MTDFDRLIDAAAREMTTAPSPVDLREKVIEEIRTRGTSLQARHHDGAEASFSIWWLAAAAGLLLTVYLGWPARQTVEQVPQVLVEGGGRAPRPKGHAPVAVEPDRPTTHPRARHTAAPQATEPAIASIPALNAPEAIAIAPLDATPDALPALDAVEPLDVERLNINPLTPPTEAAGGH